MAGPTVLYFNVLYCTDTQAVKMPAFCMVPWDHFDSNKIDSNKTDNNENYSYKTDSNKTGSGLYKKKDI